MLGQVEEIGLGRGGRGVARAEAVDRLAFENEALTSALSMAQTVVLLLCILVFRRLAGREALTA